jgi:hypothetical protein
VPPTVHYFIPDIRINPRSNIPRIPFEICSAFRSPSSGTTSTEPLHGERRRHTRRTPSRAAGLAAPREAAPSAGPRTAATSRRVIVGAVIVRCPPARPHAAPGVLGTQDLGRAPTPAAERRPPHENDCGGFWESADVVPSSIRLSAAHPTPLAHCTRVEAVYLSYRWPKSTRPVSPA